ncbi:MAG: polysaccharide deacetylase family protein [Patescibacteria group bacterium]
MRKLISKFGILYAIFCFIIVIIGGLFFAISFRGTGQATADHNLNSNQYLEGVYSGAPVDGNTNGLIATPNLDIVELTQQTDALMPILMYHHIRNYEDTSDKLGINLSVSPQKFIDQLEYIQSKGYTTTNFLELSRGNIPEKPIILTFDDGYHNFFDSAYPEIKKRNMTAVVFIITGKIGKDLYLDSAKITEMSDNGIEIGSHTISHPDLTKSKNAILELNESKFTLENLTKNQVVSFCYPSGKFLEETKLLAMKAGYLYATTTKIDIANFSDPYVLSRYRMNNDTNIKIYIK